VWCVCVWCVCMCGVCVCVWGGVCVVYVCVCMWCVCGCVCVCVWCVCVWCVCVCVGVCVVCVCVGVCVYVWCVCVCQRKAIIRTLRYKLTLKLLDSLFSIKVLRFQIPWSPFGLWFVTCKPKDGDCSEFFAGTRPCLRTAIEDMRKPCRDRKNALCFTATPK